MRLYWGKVVIICISAMDAMDLSGELTLKKIVYLSLIGILCFLLTSCTTGTTEPTQNAQQDAQNGAKPSGDTSVFFFLNSKCREAMSDAHYFKNWEKSDDKGAKMACSMFDKYLSNNKLSYDRLRFITEPAGSYYFMIAYLERELTVIRPIHIEQGVIERNTEGALDTFAKDIKVLETAETAQRLARMFHCFHAGSPMRLVTEHEDESWRAEQNEPDMKQNEDGSMTLVYDLIHTGRSVAVQQCTVNIDTDYKVTLDCKEKQKKNN